MTRSTLSPVLDTAELHELTLQARELVARAEARAAADPTNAALRAHVTMAQQKLDALLGVKPELPKTPRPTARAVRYAREAVAIVTLPEGTRFCLACNPQREGRVVRHGPGSTVVRYGSGKQVTIGDRSFTASGELVTISHQSSVRAAVEG